MLRVAIVVCLIVLLPGCKRSDINEAKWREHGAEMVMPFKKSLKKALDEGLAEGPAEAIAACRVEAPKLAAAATTPEVKVGRTSLKLRNPNNAPKPWIQPLLERYETQSGPREPRAVVIDENTVGYVEPIYVQPLCMTCHGAELAPELEAKISELYPDDQATGYEPGDFRGVFWAELAR